MESGGCPLEAEHRMASGKRPGGCQREKKGEPNGLHEKLGEEQNQEVGVGTIGWEE